MNSNKILLEKRVFPSPKIFPQEPNTEKENAASTYWKLPPTTRLTPHLQHHTNPNQNFSTPERS